MERNCEDMAKVVRQSAKWLFGSLLNHYMGNAAIVLHGEAADGSDIRLAATKQWLEANHVGKMGVGPEEGKEIILHVQQCKSDCCKKAWERVLMATPYARRGQLPGGDGLALVSAFGGGVTDIMLSRGEGMDNAIDEFKRFAPWFEERELETAEPPYDMAKHGLRQMGNQVMHLRASSGCDDE